MRKVDVELMRRHIGALRHEAHVAEGAGVDDLLEVRARDRVELAAFRFVDEIEQPREGVAQIETAPARVTNIENPAHFRVELRIVIEIGAAPIQRMPDRSLEAAFSHLCCSKTQRPSWPGLSRPSTRDAAERSPHDRDAEAQPLARGSGSEPFAGPIAWMAGSSPAMTRRT